MKGDTMTTQNEAAERLREILNLHADDWAGAEPGWMDAYLDEALATERRLTVERIRERVEALDNYDHQHDHVVLRWIDIRAILDDISKEGTP